MVWAYLAGDVPWSGSAGLGFQKGKPPVLGEGACFIRRSRLANPRIPSRLNNPLRLAQVATGRAMLLAGALSLIHRDIESEVEPFQTAALTAHLNVGWVAIDFRYDVISDEVAELGSERTIARNAQFGLPR